VVFNLNLQRAMVGMRWPGSVDASGRPIVIIVSWLDDGHVKAALARVTTAGASDTTFDVDALNRIVSVAIGGNVVVLTRCS
jgi:hypothetical protein